MTMEKEKKCGKEVGQQAEREREPTLSFISRWEGAAGHLADILEGYQFLPRKSAAISTVL